MTEVVLRLTEEEAEALEALTAGVGQLAHRELDREAGLVAALELGLTRLVEDFELPDPAVRERVGHARDLLRERWTRGNACL